MQYKRNLFSFLLSYIIFFSIFTHAAAPFHLFAYPIEIPQLQQCFGSSPDNWVQHLKSSRVWLDAWLAGLCACAFLISLLRRAFDVSSSITCELLEAWSNRQP